MKASDGKVLGHILNGDIEICLLTQADVEEALDILDENFFTKESVCNACEINLVENVNARLELRELCRLTADDGISIIARHAASGKVVGVAFNKIQYLPETNEEPFFIQFRKEKTHSPQAKCLMDFMIEVDGEKDVFEIFKIDCTCELMFLATLSQWEGKGIGRTLTSYTIELARELSQGVNLDNIHPKLRSKRPRAVTALYTSQFSQKIGRAIGFQLLNTVPYSRYSYNGKTFDERINPMHKTCEHVILHL